MTDLATLEDVAVLMGQTMDPTNKKMLNSLHAASSLVRTFTGQVFDYIEDDEVKVSGSGTQSMQLPQVPVLDVTEVTEYDYYGNVVPPAPWYLTRLDSGAGLLHRVDWTWYIGYLNYTVKYSHGYLMPGVAYDPLPTLPVEPLPDLVRQNTAAIAASLYALDPSGGRVEHEAIGNYEVNYSVAAVTDAAAFAPQLRALAQFRVIDAA